MVPATTKEPTGNTLRPRTGKQTHISKEELPADGCGKRTPTLPAPQSSWLKTTPVRPPASVSPSLTPRENRNRATGDKDTSSCQGVLHPHAHGVSATTSGTPILPRRPSSARVSLFLLSKIQSHRPCGHASGTRSSTSAKGKCGLRTTLRERPPAWEPLHHILFTQALPDIPNRRPVQGSK